MVFGAYNQVNTTFVASTIGIAHKSLVLGVAVDCGASASSGPPAIHVILHGMSGVVVCLHALRTSGRCG